MQPGAVKLEEITEGTGSDDAGKARSEVIIRFKVGKFGPFTRRFAAAGFNAAAANEAIAAFVRELGGLSSAE